MGRKEDGETGRDAQGWRHPWRVFLGLAFKGVAVVHVSSLSWFQLFFFFHEPSFFFFLRARLISFPRVGDRRAKSSRFVTVEARAWASIKSSEFLNELRLCAVFFSFCNDTD